MAASLASIDRQLERVGSQISGLNDEIEEKEEKLRRLKKAQSELISVKHDFFGEIEICLEPEFSTNTFHGDNSENYDAYRRMDLHESFREVSADQMMDAMAKMQEKINELREEIDDMEDEISGLQDRQDGLQEQRANEIEKDKEGSK